MEQVGAEAILLERGDWIAPVDHSTSRGRAEGTMPTAECGKGAGVAAAAGVGTSTAGGAAEAGGHTHIRAHKSSLVAPEGWVEPEWSMGNFVPAQRRPEEMRSRTWTASKVPRKAGKQPLLRRLTAELVEVYQLCKPEFQYSRGANPRRCLTKPAEPSDAAGCDNAEADLIVYVGDVLVSTSSQRR